MKTITATKTPEMIVSTLIITAIRQGYEPKVFWDGIDRYHQLDNDVLSEFVQSLFEFGTPTVYFRNKEQEELAFQLRLDGPMDQIIGSFTSHQDGEAIYSSTMGEVS